MILQNRSAFAPRDNRQQAPAKPARKRRKKNKSPPVRRVLEKADVSKLEQWAQARMLPEWDVLMIGDGSGCNWKIGCGWCVTVIDRELRGRKVLWGGLNRGDIMFAEGMAYLHGIMWYDKHFPPKDLLKPLRVLIVCDNQALVNIGRSVFNGNRLPKHVNYGYLWSALQYYTTRGYTFHLHWAERMSTALNRYADKIAGDVRLAVQQVPQPVDLSTAKTINIYDIHVDEHAPLLPQKLRKHRKRTPRKGKSS